MNQKEFLDTVIPVKDKLFRMAKRLLVSTEEAEDATQEIFTKLWNHRERIGTYKNVEAFAMQMTKNYCLDRLKSKQASNLKLVHSNYSDHRPLEKEIEHRDSVHWVQKIIAELPENQKMVLHLRDVEQYTFEEIEKQLGLSASNIRVLLSRARKTVREALIKKHNYGVS